MATTKSRLSNYRKVKGVLYTPWNDIENKTGIKLEASNWVHNELLHTFLFVVGGLLIVLS